MLETVEATTDTLFSRVERVVALQNEVDRQWASLYFDARLDGDFDAVVRLGPHSRTQALAMTRAENERRGRKIRWNSVRWGGR